MNASNHNGHDHGHGGHSCCATKPQAAESTAAKVTDPVCGMQVDPATTPHHAQHAGTAYHFCSARCLEKFIADPQKYLSPSKGQEPVATVPAGTIYTCPMHTEIRQ